MGSQSNQTADATVQEGLMDSRKENDAAAEGFYQKLRSRKIPFVYFLLITAVSLILLIVVIALSAHKDCVQCPDGWITYRGKCYYHSYKDNTWENSQKICKANDSSLAIIDDKEELAFLKNINGCNDRWIGLRNKGDGSDWEWADGTRYSLNINVLEILKPTASVAIQYVYMKSDGVKFGTNTTKKFICKKY